MRRAFWWSGVLTLLVASGCVREARVESPAKQVRPQPEVIGKGTASWYGPGFDGRLTASGERFNKEKLTAAHRTLPFGTCLRVRNLENGRMVRVTVNDRGPYAGGRIIDLSEAAARRLGMIDDGTTKVELLSCQ